MKTGIFFTLISLSMVSCFSKAQSFSSGNTFTAVPVYGDLHVQCRDISGEKSANFQCEDLRLAPVEYDSFVGPQEIDADSVTLSTVDHYGNNTNKLSAYSNGVSSSRFNLWISSLFQKPLLVEGENSVKYELKKDGNSVSHGAFKVQVLSGHPRTCPRGFITSANPADCDSPYTICQRYFLQYNYCL